MLGFRLSPSEEDRVSRFARAHGRKKSDIARQALNEFLDRNDGDDEFIRQVKAVAAFERSDPEAMREIEDAEAMAWRTIERLD